MTDSIKFSEVHRSNIEYERQRHLANWFIKSSPHMAKPPPNGTPTKAQQKQSSKNGTVTQNPLFFMGKVNQQHASGGNLAMSRSPVYNSQTNLPVQITSSQVQKPKLRRFISQYSNMFSVDDFENARLARRNEMEMKQRQMNRYKMNSLSSGGDCSTGDSKGSKFSNESHPELLPADIFLNRFSLPRVVRVSIKKFSDETMQSSSSNGSSASAGSSTSHKKDSMELAQPNGELYLLYRNLRDRKIYHGFNTKSGPNRKKGVMIPEEYSGYFSLVNEKGAPLAILYTSITKMVREKVYRFLSVENLPAYTESQDSYPGRPSYVKRTAYGGQIYRLLAVFEDGKQESGFMFSGHFKTGGGAGRYAQLLGENRQIIYVPLSCKGKFYEVEELSRSTLQPTSSLGPNANAALAMKPHQVFAECVHRIGTIIKKNAELPINVRLLCSQAGSQNQIPEHLTINKVTFENCVIACPIEEPEARSPLHLRKLNITADLRFIKSFLGFENEVKMFSNQNVQNILKYCQFNCENFSKRIEVEHIPVVKQNTVNGTKHKGEGLNILRPFNFPKLLRREKSMIAHEKEDSIIFLSKNDLENMESKEQSDGRNGGIVNQKMKVFQSTKKKWFRNMKPGTKDDALHSLDKDLQSKRMSLDRYQDMSKLLQERFGGDVEIDDKDESVGRASSELGVDPRRATIDNSDLRQKSMSLQDMDSHSDFSIKPDVVNVDFVVHDYPDGESRNASTEDGKESNDEPSLMSFNNQKSFITEKLCSEFHVKTKNQSKSSSNLQQLLHFQVPQKMNINDATKKGSVMMPIKPIDFSTMIPTTSIDDDLPYSSVRDSLVYQPSIDDDPLMSGANNSIHNHPENIYAEICTDGIVNGGNSSTHTTRSSAIRISVGSTTSNSLDTDRSSLRHSSIDSSSAVDNIYNTLK